MLLPVILALGLVHILKAVQVPFEFSPHQPDWDLNTPPNPNATHHLVFETASSLLQQWPNTRYRNGHALVPAHVPTGTLLYHGRGDSNVPSTPEWVATDPEHSLNFCRGFSGRPRPGPSPQPQPSPHPKNNTNSSSNCWHLTLITTRPLSLLYFDGSSAAKMPFGSMDTQDIVAWGRVDKERYFEEKNRLGAMCEWGRGVGVEGFVRMEMDFEIMLCDFTAGVRVESMLNLEEINKGRRVEERPSVRMDIEVLRAGARHNRFPGETRIRLDLTRLVSFYDTDLVPSLVDVRMGVGRLEHRLEGISPRDVEAVLGRLESAFSSVSKEGSGVDWQTLFRVVKDRYADRLELVRNLVSLDTTEVGIARDVQGQLTAMVAPYRLANASLADTYRLCATTYTRYMKEMLGDVMTPSERLLLGAVEGTTKEICRGVTRMWVWGVEAGLDGDADLELEELFGKWKEEIERLMNWLDWSVWLKCKPGCEWDELCYLPTWPWFRWGPGGRPGPPGRGPPPPAEDIDDDEEVDWIDPQPVCRKIVGDVDF